MQEKVYTIRISDLNKLKQSLRTEWAKWTMSLLRQPFTCSSTSVMTVVFSDEDKILIKKLYQLKGYKAAEETPAQSTDSQVAVDHEVPQ